VARELSLCAGAYITSDNALHAPKSGLATRFVTMVSPILAKQPFRQTSLLPKFFTIRYLSYQLDCICLEKLHCYGVTVKSGGAPALLFCCL